MVVEVVPLPALSGWPGAPAGVAGVVDYRGKVLPVVDTLARLGEAPLELRESSLLLVLRTETGGQAALLVEETLDLISLEDYRPVPKGSGLPFSRSSEFLLGVAQGGDHLVLGLDLERLLEFCKDSPVSSRLTPLRDDTGIFATRAKELAKVPDLGQETSAGTLVVVWLGGERFGIPVQEVAALADCPRYTVVPGASPHLLGLAYYKGGLLRVVDIRAMCGLKVVAPSFQAVVVLTGAGLPTGLAVDRIETVTPVKGAGSKRAFESGWLTVLDLEQMAVRESGLQGSPA